MGGWNGISCTESSFTVVCGVDLPKQSGIREQRSEQGHSVNLLLTLLRATEGWIFSFLAGLAEARRVPTVWLKRCMQR